MSDLTHSFSQEDGWRDGKGNPYRQEDIDDVDIGIMNHFPKFRPIDMAMFGSWEKERADLIFLGGRP